LSRKIETSSCREAQGARGDVGHHPNAPGSGPDAGAREPVADIPARAHGNRIIMLTQDLMIVKFL
jgi:hypothetical protein